MTLSVAGMDLLQGAVDCHVHACPHINGRTVTAFDAAREAAAAGMKGVGLMDNFSNSAGYAALAMTELGHLGIDIFGGPILEPCAGGVSTEVVAIALDWGYGPGSGARFVSMPTHHTRKTAQGEGRSPAYVEGCFHVPLKGELQDATKQILDLLAQRDVVLNTGHISGAEAVRLCQEAKKQGVERVIAPSGGFATDEIAEIVKTGAYAEFSFYTLTHAAFIPVTNIDSQAHAPAHETPDQVAEWIRAATPERTILSSDLGSYVLPPPVEGLREFLITIKSRGFSDEDLRLMVARNPIALFGVGARPAQ